MMLSVWDQTEGERRRVEKVEMMKMKYGEQLPGLGGCRQSATVESIPFLVQTLHSPKRASYRLASDPQRGVTPWFQGIEKLFGKCEIGC